MLTDTKVKALKPRTKEYRVSDGDGLHILVTPNGSKCWRYRYRFAGREKMLSLGAYPRVSLREARRSRDVEAELLAAGVDPSSNRKAKKKAGIEAQANSFAVVAEEYFEKYERSLSPSTRVRDRRILCKLADSPMGKRPISEIEPPELLAVLRAIEEKGANETAHRARGLAGRIFRYAIGDGRASRDPAADLRDALAPVVSQEMAAITDPRRVGELLRAIDSYRGQPTTIAALKLAPLLFVRPGELRKARWCELDLEADMPLWRIPAARMKMPRDHLVPLATQAVAILRELHELTGDGELVFPSLRPGRPLSENTMNVALRTMGFGGDEMTSHGFRAMADTLLNELGWNGDIVERQLAHVERNSVRRVYNRAEYLPERRKMMQAWADYLEGLRSGAQAMPIRRAAGT